jgi:uncharacterized protein YndB with AHSA1/START domain
MQNAFIAKAETDVQAPVGKVWEAFVNPDMIRQYMFGTNVVSDWKEGAPIVWQGEWQGKPYEDKGQILKLQPEHLLQYTHFSPLAGQPDLPENYHTLTIELTPQGSATHVTLSQDNNASAEEQAHSEQMWSSMLAGLKKFLET